MVERDCCFSGLVRCTSCVTSLRVHPLPQRSVVCRVYCWRARGLLYPEPEDHSLAVPLSGCWWNLKATAELSFCPPLHRLKGQCVEHVYPCLLVLPRRSLHVLPHVCDLPLAGDQLVSGPSDSVRVHCWFSLSILQVLI